MSQEPDAPSPTDTQEAIQQPATLTCRGTVWMEGLGIGRLSSFLWSLVPQAGAIILLLIFGYEDAVGRVLSLGWGWVLPGLVLFLWVFPKTWAKAHASRWSEVTLEASGLTLRISYPRSRSRLSIVVPWSSVMDIESRLEELGRKTSQWTVWLRLKDDDSCRRVRSLIRKEFGHEFLIGTPWFEAIRIQCESPPASQVEETLKAWQARALQGLTKDHVASSDDYDESSDCLPQNIESAGTDASESSPAVNPGMRAIPIPRRRLGHRVID